jgi:hypothetical protein
MRFPRHRVFIPAAAVAASTAFAACHRGDSILLVEVAGDLSLAPTSLNVTVQPSQAGYRTFMIAPKDGAAITLPASLSVEMAPTFTGPLTVEVDAIERGYVVASGTTTQQEINVGGQTIVVVTLVGGSMPTVDAGSDAIPGTGGEGGTAGRPGSGGEPGAGGMGGLGGTGGSETGGVSGTGGLSGTGGKGTGGSGTGGSGTGGSGTGGSGTGGSGTGGKGTGGSGTGGSETGGAGGTSDAGGDA